MRRVVESKPRDHQQGRSRRRSTRPLSAKSWRQMEAVTPSGRAPLTKLSRLQLQQRGAEPRTLAEEQIKAVKQQAEKRAWCLLVLSLVRHVSAEPYEDEEEPAQQSLKQGILFIQAGRILLTDEKWTLAIDIDFSQYASDVEKLQKLALAAKDRSSTGAQLSAPLPPATGMEYDLLLDRLKATADNINRIREATYPAIINRPKRGLIDLAGQALKFLIGTPDARDLREINSKLSKFENFQQRTVQVLEAHATLFNATYDLTMDNVAKFKRLEATALSYRNELIALVYEADSKVGILRAEYTNYAFTASTVHYLSSMASTMENRVTNLEVAINQAINGLLSSYLVSPHELFTILSDVHSQDMVLPFPVRRNSIHKYYELAVVKPAVMEGRYRIFVEFPLSSKQREFSLYQAMPLPNYDPTAKVFVYIQPENPFFAISDDRIKFLELANLDICTGDAYRVCAPHVPIRTAGSSCLHSLFTAKPAGVETLCTKRLAKQFRSLFYKSSFDNKWVFSVSEPTQMLINCADRHFVKHLNGTGFLNLAPNCEASTDGLELIPHSNEITPIKSVFDRFFVPEMNKLEGELKASSYGSNNSQLSALMQSVLNDSTVQDVYSAGLSEKQLHQLFNTMEESIKRETVLRGELNKLSKGYSEINSEFSTVSGFFNTASEGAQHAKSALIVALFLLFAWAATYVYKLRNKRVKANARRTASESIELGNMNPEVSSPSVSVNISNPVIEPTKPRPHVRLNGLSPYAIRKKSSQAMQTDNEITE